MSENSQHHSSGHHHHHHQSDAAHEFKRRSLDSIVFRQRMEKIVKAGLVILAIVMAVGVVASYFLL
jgi:hypothetical protein